MAEEAVFYRMCLGVSIIALVGAAAAGLAGQETLFNIFIGATLACCLVATVVEVVALVRDVRKRKHSQPPDSFRQL